MEGPPKETDSGEHSREETPYLGSSADKRLVRFKRDMVRQLYLKRGEFWQMIRDMRSHWGITAATALPPGVQEPLLYLKLPKQGPKSDLVRLRVPTLYPREMEILERNQWEFELDDIKAKTVHPRYSQASEWRQFLSACVLYDPPETALVEFGEYGAALPEIGELRGEEAYEMLAPPVWRLPNPHSWASAYRIFYEAMIREIGERHLEPLGINIHAMFREVFQNTELYNELEENLAQVPRDYYIKIDDHTTNEDVRSAYTFTRPNEQSEEGAPQRDPLVAIQCAILYDRHNSSRSPDRRRRRWTYRRLAEKFELKSARAAKYCVESGRGFLKNNR